MLSTIIHRSLSPLSVCCVAFAVLGASIIQAAEFKPFLSLQIAGPSTFISAAERVATIAGEPQLTQSIAMAAPFKNLPGVNAAGTIGLAIQANEESAFGVEAIVSLPINNFLAFNIPGWEMYVMSLKMMAKPEGGKFIFATPVGNFVGYQKQGFFLLATEGAAEFAATADHRTLFAEINEFSLGFHANLENITQETLATMLNSIMMMLAAQQGMGGPADPAAFSAFLDQAKEAIEEMSSVTWGITIDPRTLDITGSTKTVPKTGTALAEKHIKSKGALAKTPMGAFLPDTPNTVFAWHYLDYFTDREIDEMHKALELVGGNLIEGLHESMEEEDADEARLEIFINAAEAFCHHLADGINFLARERVLDSSYWLDSEGTFILAIGTDKTDTVAKLNEKFHGKLLSILGTEATTFIESRMKRNYETVAGFSLSCIPNVFADLPADVSLPEEIRTVVQSIPLSLFWAVKNGEALVYAVGLDFTQTEQTLKSTLNRAQTPQPPPKQMGFVAAKPLADFILNKILPLDPNPKPMDMAEARAVFAPFTAASPNLRYVATEEYSDTAYTQKAQIPGELVTAIIRIVVEGGRLQ